MTSLYARAWQTIFDTKPILESIREYGYFDISADEIKHISNREPRLLTKVDFRDALPDIMKQGWLSILAIENGLYRIAKSDPFVDIPKRMESTVRLSAPSGFVTIDPFDITSESMALDIAKVSWMLDTVFWEETELTIRGRLRKGSKFDFELNNVNYPVDGVQIEVDWGYEWHKTVNLVEAKLGSIRTLNIRQLLYPELAWKGLVWEYRNVRSYAFIYEESVFRFIPFITKSWVYCLDSEAELAFKFKDAKEYDIMGIRLSDKPNLNFNAPFPQADDFDKVLIMLKKLHVAWWEANKDELSLMMGENDIWNSRQIDYYLNCLKLFKLADNRNGVAFLTERWFELATEANKAIAFEIAKCLFSEKVFHTALHHWIWAVTDGMLEYQWKKMSWSTVKRRKGTLSSWINWYRTVFDLV